MGDCCVAKEVIEVVGDLVNHCNVGRQRYDIKEY